MKRNFAFLAAAVAMFMIACKPENPTPKPEPEPEPTPTPVVPTPSPDDEEWDRNNCIAYVGSDDKPVKRVELKSGASFVSSAGFYSFYMADIDGLSKKMLTAEDFELPQTCSIAAVSVMSPLLGKDVDILEEKMHWMMAVRLYDLLEMDLSEEKQDRKIETGSFRLDIDREKNEASLQIKISFAGGEYLWCSYSCAYTPGGENDSVFLWGDMSRPVRAAFYDEPVMDGFEDTMYFSSGEIEYGEDLGRTTYAAMAIASEACDGQSHDIAELTANDKLVIMARDFDSEWDIIEGTVMVKKLGEHQYEVVISGAIAADIYRELANTTLDIVFSGTLKDVNTARPIDNSFTYGGKEHSIGSCVVDLSGDVASLYFTEKEGVTTVDEAIGSNPLTVRISAGKWGTSVGLSTDREVFCVSYDGNDWNKDNLDTGSFICHEYDPESGILHCQVANLYLKNSSKAVLKMEYKGTPTYIR